ncbi:MAG: hypothetical protein ACK4N6_00375 [Rhodocyclaceae bacterium]
MQNKSRILPYALSSVLVFGALGLIVCATHQATSSSNDAAKQAQPATAEKSNYFLVFHENGRLYAFGDAANYLLFMEHGEVPLTRTRIGGGPDGQTVVFGITKDDAKMVGKPSTGEMFFDGKMGEVGAFYGEVFRDGRYYVFGEWKDFKDYLEHKEVAFTYTEIGAGPKGETVIYALNKKTKDKGRPLELIEAFKQLRQKK